MKTKIIYSKIVINLLEEEKIEVSAILKKGIQPIRLTKHAQVLQLFDKGFNPPKIAKILEITPKTARNIGRKYSVSGFNAALYGPPRSGAPKKINKDQVTRIAALTCSDPPEGYERWTINLLTEHVRRKKIISEVSRETVRIILRDHKIKPWRKKNVVCS